MMDPIVILGAGGHAKVLIEIIKKLEQYQILGYTDKIDRGPVLGVNYLGNDSILIDIKRKYQNCKAVIGVGTISISSSRQRIYEMLKNIGFELPVIVSKDAIVNEGAHIKEGAVLLEGAIANVNSVIGKCAIINTKAEVGHDSVVGDFVHLAAGANLGGGVEIGDNCVIGVGTKVIQLKKIVADTLIGAGSIVISDIMIKGIYFGVPARKINIEIINHN